MPGKARRVASRQAQLGRRKKRQLREPGDLAMPIAAPTEVDENQDGADLSAVLEAPNASPDTSAATAAVRAKPAPAAAPVRTRPERLSPVAARNVAATGLTDRNPSRARREQSATYNYVGAEFRRILLLSTVVLAIIIVLGVVL